MSAAIDRTIEKQRRRYDEAASAMAAAVTEASTRAAVYVIQAETGALSELALRAEVREQGAGRRVLSTRGRLLDAVLRSSLSDPWGPEAFDAAVFAAARLLCVAWMTKGAAK